MSGVPAPTPSLGLSFGLSSAAETGDVITQPEFDVSFGDKIAGTGANAGTSIVTEIIKGVAVAIAARYAWELLK